MHTRLSTHDRLTIIGGCIDRTSRFGRSLGVLHKGVRQIVVFRLEVVECVNDTPC